ncbi:hypothetical protein [Photorhabdus thracensis]|uniref:hypothetical protein n=1 Tax=Photorhabdus thracensis TaxID=230089 RepID=UPI00138E1BB6|nr:hypothetical protein [Photorhabdus thracensis]
MNGVRKTFIEDERVVSARDATSFSQADFPALDDTQTQSDFFLVLMQSNAGDDVA